MKTVLFSHGKESGPWGSKITQLASVATALGYAVDSLDYTAIASPEQRVALLDERISQCEGVVVLAGSSMGGYVSLVASMRHKIDGLFLLAPALYLPGYQVQAFTTEVPTCIVHGWHDDIVPLTNVFRFAQLTHASLHILDSDHRLNSAMREITPLFHHFLTTYDASASIAGGKL